METNASTQSVALIRVVTHWRGCCADVAADVSRISKFCKLFKQRAGRAIRET